MISETARGAIVFRKKDMSVEYLLLKYRRYGQNHWDFVKGAPEGKESLEETVKREVEEETGILKVIICEGFIEKRSYNYEKNNGTKVKKDVTLLLTKVGRDEKIKLSEEHSHYKWASIEECKKILEFKDQKEILEKANKFIISS